MKQKSKNEAFWLKGFAWLLVLMLLFTIISRAADAFTVAKVSVVNPSARKLQYRAIAEGRIEKNREISVLTCPDLLVKSIRVSEGQRVKKGELLAKLDKDSLKEQIGKLEDEKRVLELENEAAKANKRQEKIKQQENLARAREDYARIKRKNGKALMLAEKELKKAKDKLKKQKKKGAGQGENSVAALRATVEEKRKAYRDLKETKKTEEREAKRAIEDALPDTEVDNSDAIHQISIRSLDQQLQKLLAVKKQKGRILAPENGVVTEVLISVGQKTPDSGIFNMTDDSAGLKFVGQLMAEDAKYVSAGDTVTLRTAGQEEEVSVTSLEMDESQEFIKLTALLPAKLFSLGETASVSIKQESENYSCTVPVTSVYQENNREYVYLVQTEDTVLGKQEVARKMEVKVLEKNSAYAALEDGVLDSESQIIADTDRFVESGDRVRLKEGE